jgi:TolB-like protein/DNA-binding winged helix-turn-helix (wHTH) protein/Tfp pilus assembly protein PilF
MPRLPESGDRLRFGVFEVNLAAHEVRKHGVRVKLAGQPFEILTLLLEHPYQIVTRVRLRERLWPADTFVDFEHSLNSAIKKLRAALGDSPENSRYVETVPRVGYRFIAPVERLTPPAALSPPVSEPPSLGAPSDGVHRFLGRRGYAAAAALAVLAATAVLYSWRSAASRRAAPPGNIVLAVLPFENLSGDAQQEYFSDGLTEEMILQLGRIEPRRMTVIARESVMRYKSDRERLEHAARDLGVQYVLVGTVRRDADRVRVTAELLETGGRAQLLTRSYDRSLRDILSVQSDVAGAIANEIRSRLDTSPRHQISSAHEVDPTHQPLLSVDAYEAYDLYLRGRYFWNKRTPQGLQQAIKCFEQAVAKEPTYARAYAGMADSHALMSGYSLAPPRESAPKARAAALRALEIDEGLAEAHASLASIAQNYDWDWQTAEKEYRRAIELDPNYATAHHWYAEYLALEGRFAEAFGEIERARQLDPLSLIIATDNGEIFYLSRQYDRAVEQFRGVLDMEPSFPRAHLFLDFTYAQMGMVTDALADIEKWRRTDDTPWSWTMLAYVYSRSHQLAQAQSALEKLKELNRRRRFDPGAILCAYVGMADMDQALPWFEKAYSERSTALTSLKVNPLYDPVRSDPRFQVLLRRVFPAP